MHPPQRVWAAYPAVNNVPFPAFSSGFWTLHLILKKEAERQKCKGQRAELWRVKQFRGSRAEHPLCTGGGSTEAVWAHSAVLATVLSPLHTSAFGCAVAKWSWFLYLMAAAWQWHISIPVSNIMVEGRHETSPCFLVEQNSSNLYILPEEAMGNTAEKPKAKYSSLRGLMSHLSLNIPGRTANLPHFLMRSAWTSGGTLTSYSSQGSDHSALHGNQVQQC